MPILFNREGLLHLSSSMIRKSLTRDAPGEEQIVVHADLGGEGELVGVVSDVDAGLLAPEVEQYARAARADPVGALAGTLPRRRDLGGAVASAAVVSLAHRLLQPAQLRQVPQLLGPGWLGALQ